MFFSLLQPRRPPQKKFCLCSFTENSGTVEKKAIGSIPHQTNSPVHLRLEILDFGVHNRFRFEIGDCGVRLERARASSSKKENDFQLTPQPINLGDRAGV
ncbi:MAG: hypothetical protein EAZ19_25960 [Oscillatoriales cyanobacterium]|nr:MAG: hypothetical protein EAZ49_17315 [Oscillatoriales cyanobacterium]TAG88179.1 MAG: hypothetical protein EAZ19_25960 [Oscillatoriales cyanobacterium]